jgi:hypothetical protein
LDKKLRAYDLNIYSGTDEKVFLGGRAARFERYVKPGSGRAFARKHLE